MAGTSAIVAVSLLIWVALLHTTFAAAAMKWNTRAAAHRQSAALKSILKSKVRLSGPQFLRKIVARHQHCEMCSRACRMKPRCGAFGMTGRVSTAKPLPAVLRYVGRATIAVC